MTAVSGLFRYKGDVADKRKPRGGLLGERPKVTYKPQHNTSTYLSRAHDGRHESSSSPGPKRPVLVVHYDLRFVMMMVKVILAPFDTWR